MYVHFSRNPEVSGWTAPLTVCCLMQPPTSLTNGLALVWALTCACSPGMCPTGPHLQSHPCCELRVPFHPPARLILLLLLHGLEKGEGDKAVGYKAEWGVGGGEAGKAPRERGRRLANVLRDHRSGLQHLLSKLSKAPASSLDPAPWTNE